MRSQTLDAVVVGAGPNGLAAAVTLARAGRSVRVFEARETVGGGARTAELTLPGFHHDVCSAIHPLARSSAFFRELPLGEHGLEWIEPPLPLAHPLEDGRAVVLSREVTETAAVLGADARAYERLFRPLVDDWRVLSEDILGPLRLPRHPIPWLRFGIRAFRSARGLAEGRFEGEAARALFAGLAAHANLPLESPLTAAFGLVLGALGHAVGWPVARGGSQRIAGALAAQLRSLGGEIRCGEPIASLGALPAARVVLLDVTPRQLRAIAGDALPDRHLRKLGAYRYGAGVFKLDYALEGPIPWRNEQVRRAGTVHVGGRLEEIAASEAAVAAGRAPERPYVLVAQQSLFDASRAPAGKHTGWAYCHVPHGSTEDMTDRIEAQIERFAPGFRDRILARHRLAPADLERYDANYVGGDINGGSQDWRQLFTRPTARWVPYSTPNPRLFLCSSSTPPGGGVHGLCGYHAARAALRGALR